MFSLSQKQSDGPAAYRGIRDLESALSYCDNIMRTALCRVIGVQEIGAINGNQGGGRALPTKT